VDSAPLCWNSYMSMYLRPRPRSVCLTLRGAAPRREVVVVRKHAGHLRGTNVSRGPAAPSSPILSAAFFARRAVRRHS
jgi:hypothetical protein